MASTKTATRTGIDSVMAFFMVGVALMVDFLQMVVGITVLIPIFGLILAPLLGFFIGVTAWLIFFFWFKLLGVNFFERVDAKVVVWLAGALAEITPLGILPIWTLTIALTIVITNAKRVEEKV